MLCSCDFAFIHHTVNDKKTTLQMEEANNKIDEGENAQLRAKISCLEKYIQNQEHVEDILRDSLKKKEDILSVTKVSNERLKEDNRKLNERLENSVSKAKEFEHLNLVMKNNVIRLNLDKEELDKQRRKFQSRVSILENENSKHQERIAYLERLNRVPIWENGISQFYLPSDECINKLENEISLLKTKLLEGNGKSKPSKQIKDENWKLREDNFKLEVENRTLKEEKVKLKEFENLSLVMRSNIIKLNLDIKELEDEISSLKTKLLDLKGENLKLQRKYKDTTKQLDERLDYAAKLKRMNSKLEKNCKDLKNATEVITISDCSECEMNSKKIKESERRFDDLSKTLQNQIEMFARKCKGIK